MLQALVTMIKVSKKKKRKKREQLLNLRTAILNKNKCIPMGIHTK